VSGTHKPLKQKVAHQTRESPRDHFLSVYGPRRRFGLAHNIVDDDLERPRVARLIAVSPALCSERRIRHEVL